MLLLLPTPTVPLLVALALIITTLIDALRGRVARDRALLSVADAWFALAPAAVLIVGGAQTPDWADWPVYVAALLAMIALDSVIYVARVWACLGEDPRTVLGELKMAHRVDALLFPVGLLAAFAAVDQPYAVLLVLPLAGLFTIFAGEREARVEQALELSGAYRGTALLLGDVIEADDAYTGAAHARTSSSSPSRSPTSSASTTRRAGARRVRRAAARRRQDRDPERDHQQARAARRRGVGDHEDPHDRGPADARDASAGCSAKVGLVVRASHERYDGGGYPDGLAGEQIPLAARIVSACDAFNAMTTDRSYREAMRHEARGGAARQRRHAVRP